MMCISLHCVCEEISAYLGMKRDTLYKWIDRKSMSAHKIGRLWKFRKEEIDEWVRNGSVGNAISKTE